MHTSEFSPKLFRRILSIALIANALNLTLPTSVKAMSISAGIGALEEGDDRSRAAAIVHLGFQNQWYSRFYLWGRTYGPVSEKDAILTVAKETGVFGSKNLMASAGLSLMANQTSITYKDYPEENTSYTNTNVGLLLGLRYDIFSTKNMSVSASWDSHLFAAGDAVILLVTGRKQILGLTAGLTW